MTHRTGVIDLGSNTSRLVIYEHEPGVRFRLVDEVREVVRLREGMGATHVLRAAAIDRSLHALKMYRMLCDAVGVDDLLAVATSAVRDAANRDSFLSRVRTDAGVTLRLLPGEEEAYYGALGAINGVGLADGFVVDMGGGSVQVTQVKAGLPGRAASVPLGALEVAENYLGFDVVKPGAVRKLSQHVRDQLAEQFDWFRAQDGAKLVAIGGTIRNLASIAQNEDGYPLDSVDNYVLAGADVRELGERLWQMTAEERARLGGLQVDRADIIHAGALIYSLLLEHSGFESITVSRQGLREGLFYEKFLAGQEQPVVSNLRGSASITSPVTSARIRPMPITWPFCPCGCSTTWRACTRWTRRAGKFCGPAPCSTTSACRSGTTATTSTRATSFKTASCPVTRRGRRSWLPC